MTPFREFFGRSFDFKGRSSKHAIWVTLWIMGLLNILALAGIASATGATPETPSPALAIALIASWVPWLALSVRRLHDSDRSGWRMLLALTGVGCIPLLWWHMVDGGTRGPNRFGPDPLGRSAPGARAVDSDGAMDELKALGALRDQGVLTETEFNAKKERLLASI